MAINRGKQFEGVVRQSIQRLVNVSIDRLYDSTNGFKGIAGICDFIVYKYPYQLYLECKSIHGNTFPLSNITQTQYTGMLLKSCIKGVHAGVMIWFVDKDVTLYVPISTIRRLKDIGSKSIRYDITEPNIIVVKGVKKRVFYDYDMNDFFKEVFKDGTGYKEKN